MTGVCGGDVNKHKEQINPGGKIWILTTTIPTILNHHTITVQSRHIVGVHFVHFNAQIQAVTTLYNLSKREEQRERVNWQFQRRVSWQFQRCEAGIWSHPQPVRQCERLTATTSSAMKSNNNKTARVQLQITYWVLNSRIRIWIHRARRIRLITVSGRVSWAVLCTRFARCPWYCPTRQSLLRSLWKTANDCPNCQSSCFNAL